MCVSVAEKLPHALDLNRAHRAGEEGAFPGLELCRHDEARVHVPDVVLAEVGGRFGHVPARLEVALTPEPVVVVHVVRQVDVRHEALAAGRALEGLL